MSFIKTIDLKYIPLKNLHENLVQIYEKLNYNWISENRWYVDKESNIINISCEDYSTEKISDEILIINGIILIKLEDINKNIYIKRYFLPIIVSNIPFLNVKNDEVIQLILETDTKYLIFAEHHKVYQDFLVKSYMKNSTIETFNNGKFHFIKKDSYFDKENFNQIYAEPLNVSTSNILTKVTVNGKSILSKGFKDLRGYIDTARSMWPLNLESSRYDVLHNNSYPNIASLYGISYYEDKYGNKLPTNMIIEYLDNEGEIGGVYWDILSEKLNHMETSSVFTLDTFKKLSTNVMKSVANMHIHFSKSNKSDFKVSKIPETQLDTIKNSLLSSIENNLDILNIRLKNNTHNYISPIVKSIQLSLGEFKSSKFLKLFNKTFNSLCKTQVHGDMSFAQGVICKKNNSNLKENLIYNFLQYDEYNLDKNIIDLVDNLKWIDFEGEPAKKYVSKDYDSRQSVLRDVASIINGLWYLVNVKIQLHLNLDCKTNEADRYLASKLSLCLADILSIEDSSFENLNKEIILFVKSCFKYTKNAIIESYLNEIEQQNSQHIIMNNYSRYKSKLAIEFWILSRSIHELSYETYARNWGWESIPGSLVLKQLKCLTKSISDIEYIKPNLKVMPLRDKERLKGFSPVYAGKIQNGLFIPFQHDHSQTENLFDSRYHWGVGDFSSSREGIDLVAKLGYNIRKILPITWSSAFHSPYSVMSIKALDPEYLGIPDLLIYLEDNFIDVSKAKDFITLNHYKIKSFRNDTIMDHEGITNLKIQVLKIIWEIIKNYIHSNIYKEYINFSKSMSYEFKDDLLYYILKQEHMKLDPEIGWDWRTWSQTTPGLTERNPHSLVKARKKYAKDLEFLEFMQYVLYKQWDNLKSYAADKKVDFMIDVPFSPADSSVWQNPNIVMMSDVNHRYQRNEVQGVPGKAETPLGQIWQFSAYNFNTSDSLKYLYNVFEIYSNLSKYVRCDHTLGYYQIFVFRQDVNESITLKSLNIFDKIEDIRKTALDIGTVNAKSKAAYEVYELIKKSLVYPNHDIKLNAESYDLLFRDGEVKVNGGNMLIISRQVNNLDIIPNKYWHREYQVEDKVLKNQPHWDFLRLSPNKRAKDNGFCKNWLFPEDDTLPPQPTDGIRVAYYKYTPGEEILTEIERICQENGVLLGHELLGNIPNEIEKSMKNNIGGFLLKPKIWGLSKKSKYHPLNNSKDSISMLTIADSPSIVNGWLDCSTKEEMLNDFKLNMNSNLDHFNNLIHENLLNLAFNPEKIYPQIIKDNIPLISILGLIDLAGLDDTYRLNFPGTQTSWNIKLPKEARTGELLAFLNNQYQNEKTENIIKISNNLTNYRKSKELNKLTEIELLGVRPTQDVQIRIIDSDKPQCEKAFIIEAYISGSPKEVYICFEDDTTTLTEIPMAKLEKTSIKDVYNWIVKLISFDRGILKYRIKVVTPNDTIYSNTKYLVATSKNDDLNPLSDEYALRDMEF